MIRVGAQTLGQKTQCEIVSGFAGEMTGVDILPPNSQYIYNSEKASTFFQTRIYTACCAIDMLSGFPEVGKFGFFKQWFPKETEQ